jgi:hypothetical protein
LLVYLLSTYKGCILLFGAFLAHRTRNLPSLYNESLFIAVLTSTTILIAMDLADIVRVVTIPVRGSLSLLTIL